MALTTCMRSWQDFEFVSARDHADVPVLGDVLPARRTPTRCVGGALTPLYQGVALVRAMALGTLGVGALFNVLYLAAMGTIGLVVAGRRLGALLLT